MAANFQDKAAIVGIGSTEFSKDSGRSSLSRAYGAANPAAFFYNKPLTRAEYDNARKIAEPFGLYDCCQENDGGSAVVLTTPERARHLKLGDRVVATGKLGLRGTRQGQGFHPGRRISPGWSPAHQYPWRTAQRGLYSRHERRPRGGTPGARRLGQSAEEIRQQRHRHLGHRRADRRHAAGEDAIEGTGQVACY